MNLNLILVFLFVFYLAPTANANTLKETELKSWTVSNVYVPTGTLNFVLELKSESTPDSTFERQGTIADLPYIIKGRLILIGFGVSAAKIREYSDQASNTSKLFPLFLWINRAHAQCHPDNVSRSLGEVTNSVNELSLTETVKSCDFSLKDLIQKKNHRSQGGPPVASKFQPG